MSARDDWWLRRKVRRLDVVAFRRFVGTLELSPYDLTKGRITFRHR